MIYSVAVVLGLLVVYRTALALLCWRRLGRLAQLHGCQPPAQVPQRERILGYGLFKSDLEAAAAGKIMVTGQRRFQELGTTFAGSCMGTDFISTIDPDNIRAVLAAQSDHF